MVLWHCTAIGIISIQADSAKSGEMTTSDDVRVLLANADRYHQVLVDQARSLSRGEEFLLDIEGNDISDEDLKEMLVSAMNLARVGTVTIFRK
jgi:hypothetical protein